MKNGFATTEREGSFYCGAEWHLQQMKSRLACPLYNWARRLSQKSGVLSASAEHMAEYFGVNRKTVLCALEELAESGFLVIDRSERFRPNTYKVLDHKEWIKRHPNRCVGKVSFPWEGEGDPLGRQLYAISGGRVKFWPRQMTGLRNLGFSDEQIIERFQSFIDQASYTGKRWKHAYYDFYAHLEDLVVVGTRSNGSSRTDSARVQSNGHHRVQSNGHAESSPTDSSSRSSSRKEVDECESTIPAPRRLASYPSFENKEKEETTTADLDDNYPRLKDYLPPSSSEDRSEEPTSENENAEDRLPTMPAMSDAEFEVRKELLKRQAAEIMLGRTPAGVGSVNAA